MDEITQERMRVEIGKALEDARKKGKILADFCEEKGWDPPMSARAMIDAAGTIIGMTIENREELAAVVQLMVRAFGEKAATTFHAKETRSDEETKPS